MQYPLEFIYRAKKLIRSREFYGHLENGDECVGEYLLNAFQGKSISPEEFVKAVDHFHIDKLNYLYKKAKKIVELKNLYHEWGNFYNLEK